MVFAVLLTLILLLVLWILLSPVDLYIDTRKPEITLRWISILEASVYCVENDWILTIDSFVFKKQFNLFDLISTGIGRKQPIKPAAKKRKKPSLAFSKFLNMLNTFQIKEWQLAMDTGDYVTGAWLYPLNFMPGLFGHMHLNFSGQNFLVLRIRNQPWRLAFAFLK